MRVGFVATWLLVGCTSVSGLDGLTFGADGSGGATSTTVGGGGLGAGGTGAGAGAGGAGGVAGSGGQAPDYAAAVLEAAPAGYWRLGEMSGPYAEDATPANQDGTYFGGVSYGAPGIDDVDSAVAFDGIDGRVSMGDILDFAAAPFSVEAWIKPAMLPPGGTMGICGKRDQDSNGYQGYILRLDSSGSVQFVMWRDNTRVDVTSPVALELGRFHHVVGVNDGTNVIVYVDTIAEAVGGAPPLIDQSGELIIGEDVSQGHFEGVIDEVAIYQVALSPAQIAAHYALGQ